ncbi:MAG: sigma-54-dependent Fis family transcriptional regulator [Gammaproteobacteria bacterium]|jgi:two-component system response regulator AtoC|nr:sigma-54-dependent Fis family transcriptional regulator [Gammaproteobacteria bacterium]MBT3725720.1 sigma-54-dependent Fis family transcriptional regulator [Gammaproteobacteria bacterium]MBT4075762.1 sigma-54-dependent Fis family transcriptional regulator [Gammaproteobacteria bacterium]MBT4195476.1 sigma-54-dependent Fis family transcriptional regulator [Gammaproteobacteria bacterium]MBT4449417.1 sigma-54-dependent Fis family transcriptional regulator [Gammaproteobacteria bacterium]
MRSLQVLIIDDEPAIRQILSNTASKAGHSVLMAANGLEALSILSKGDIDVALCDIRMPDFSGIEVVEKARKQGIETIFLMMTAFASVNTAIDAMRAGAYDYMLKPLRNEDVINRLEHLADVIHLRSENEVLRELVRGQDDSICQMISPAMKEVERLIMKVAPTDSTVLITGPSGAGKGIISRSIHQNSQRSEQSFIPVNCGAIPENLLESEFFGHTKGAFTGANKAKRGLFAEADQGTIFLDEIGELPLNLQVKLLHVIEDQTVRALGSEQSRKINVRIVAATNQDLADMVKQGTFREDLYFRLNVFHIPLHPLAERKEDIPELIKHFINRESVKMGLNSAIDIHPAAMQSLLSYKWPGNVRELQNAIARALILAESDCIEASDLPQNINALDIPTFPTPSGSMATLKQQLHSYEIAVIKKAIKEARGDRKLAANQLGIGVSSLYRKLEDDSEKEN